MITKKKLRENVDAAKNETRNAIQVIFDSLNQGQQKKILKNDKAKEIFDRFGVEYE